MSRAPALDPSSNLEQELGTFTMPLFDGSTQLKLGAFDDSANKLQPLYGLCTALAAEHIDPFEIDLY